MSVTFRASVARRQRAFVSVTGPDAESLLQSVLSNDVAALQPGDACEALLLTNKARVIAPVRVVRRDADDFLLLTEPELGDVLERHLLRFRLAAKAAVEREDHASFVVLGAEAPPGASLVVPTDEYGVPAVEVIDGEVPGGATEAPDDELELLRIRAGIPRWGREIDDRVLPAEAGLVERAVSLTKGCFPGQEPIARLHYRGHANRGLRVLELEGDEVPEDDAEVRLGERAVGRVTSAAATGEGSVLALAYVRRDVPPDAGLEVAGRVARPLS